MSIKYELVTIKTPKEGRTMFTLRASGVDYKTQSEWFYKHKFNYFATRLTGKAPYFGVDALEFAKAYPKNMNDILKSLGAEYVNKALDDYKAALSATK